MNRLFRFFTLPDNLMIASTNSPLSTRLYVNERIAPYWKEVMAYGSPCQFFSPFVTGEVAQEILLTGGQQVALYTVFTVKNFASDASSLECIEQLVTKGIVVYHVPRLHAKMLLVPGKLVTVGSQNLTTGGTTNREASVVITDKTVVATAESETAEWRSVAVRVTQPQIDDMRGRVAEVRKLYEEAKTAAAKADEASEQQERERVEKESQKKQNIKKLQRSAGALRRAEPVPVKVCRVNRNTFVNDSFDIFAPVSSPPQLDTSLLVRGQRSLTRWKIGDGTVRLRHYCRYLCITEDTGKLGWVRVGSSRISFISDGVSHGERLSFRDLQWKVVTNGLWSDLEEGVCNLKVTLACVRGQEAELDCWFSIKGLKVVRARWTKLPSDEKPCDFAAAIEANEGRLRTNITRLLVKPFKYVDGQKLTGFSASYFFGDVGKKYNICLAKVGNRDVLIARKR